MQTEMAEDSVEFTAFITRAGLWEWLRMPFGPMNGPSAQQTWLDCVLSGLPIDRFSRYIDDVKISSNGMDCHYEDLEEVLKRFAVNNISIRLDKCEFFKSQIHYLGHIIDAHGMRPDPDKVSALKHLPSPKNQKELLSSDGKIGYYRRYVRGYSQIAAPLQPLKHKDRPWEWNETHENAFRTLISRVCDALMLHFPHPDGEWIIETDASFSGIGAILSQRIRLPAGRSEERIIAICSRGLRPSEKKYGVTEIEGLGVVYAFEQFRPYVLGRYCELITDHSALRFIFHGSCTNARLMRWAVQLQEYDFLVRYRKGALNRADGISRAPKDPAPPEYDHVTAAQARWNLMFADDHVPDPVPISGVHESALDKHSKALSAATTIVAYVAGARAHTVHPSSTGQRFETLPGAVVASIDAAGLANPPSRVPSEELTLDHIRTAQLTDDFCQQLTRTLKNVASPSDIVALRGTDTTRFILHLNVVYFLHGPARKSRVQPADFHLLEPALAVVLPTSCQAAALKLSHDDGFSGHFGVLKTIERLRDRFYWPTLAHDVTNYCQSCQTCAIHKRDYYHGMYPVGSLPLPKRLFGRMQIDLIGPFPVSTGGFRFILVCVCARTRWAEAFPLKTKTAQEVADCIVDELVCRYGVADELLTDHGSEFVNQLLAAINERFKTDHLHSAPYHPACNGSVERLNGTLVGVLKRIVSSRSRQADWHRFLPAAMFAYRSALHSEIKMTPFQAIGFNPRTPLDQRLNLPVDELDTFDSQVDHRFRLTNKLLEEAYTAAESRKALSNAQLTLPTRVWKVGSTCYCKIDSRPEDPIPKLAAKYSGPYDIIAVNVNGLSLRVRNKHWPRREKTVHVDKCKPCVQRDALFVDNADDLIATDEICPGEHVLVRPDLSQNFDPQLWICKIDKVDEHDPSQFHVHWYSPVTLSPVRPSRKGKAAPLGPFHLDPNWPDKLHVSTFMLVFDNLTPIGTLPVDLMNLARKCYEDQGYQFPDS
jgi:hypothetical protein